MRNWMLLAVLLLIVSAAAPAAAQADPGFKPHVRVVLPFAEASVTVDAAEAPAPPTPPPALPTPKGTSAPEDVEQATDVADDVVRSPPVLKDLPVRQLGAGRVTVSYDPHLTVVVDADGAPVDAAPIQVAVHEGRPAAPSAILSAEPRDAAAPGDEPLQQAAMEPLPATAGPALVQSQPVPKAFPLGDAVTRTIGVAGLMFLLGLLALYHRTRNREVLENTTRGRIMDLVGERPGITLQELAEETGTQYDSVVYHVERLRKENLVVRSGKKPIRLFDPSFPDRDRHAVAALRNDGSRQVLEAVLASPGTPKAAIGRTLGLTGPSVTWHIERLQAAGLVTIRENKVGLGMEITADVERLRAICRRLAGRGEELPSLL